MTAAPFTRLCGGFVLLLLAVGPQAGCAPVSRAEAQTVAPAHVQRGEWFKQTGCTACHSVSVYNVLNIGAVAPDLSLAVEDVPRRFGQSLDEFLQAPTGTMAMVLATRIPMAPADRDVAIEKLKEAYREHLAARPVRPATSH